MANKIFTNAIINQALKMGFDFSQFDYDTEVLIIEKRMIDFFNENSEMLESIEDECEVVNNGRSQHVSYGEFESEGEIVRFSDHWHKPAETKIYHSDFVMEHEGIMKRMNLYYKVGETEYNTNI